MTDSVLRAITDDGAFRVIAVRTTSTVQGAVDAQATSGDIARLFGDLLTGAVLVRETMAPDLRVQGIIKTPSKSQGSIVADSHPDGSTRGLVNLRTAQLDAIQGVGSILQMMRTLPNGALHSGIVEVPEPGGVSAALMAYMKDSEQVDTVVAVGTVLDANGKVQAAGGYLVQLLPEASQDALAAMVKHLSAFENIETLLRSTFGEPKALTAALLEGTVFTQLVERPLKFACQCSPERVLSSLATLPRAELNDMLEERKVFEINCDYCNKAYGIGPGDLQRLLDVS